MTTRMGRGYRLVCSAGGYAILDLSAWRFGKESVKTYPVRQCGGGNWGCGVNGFSVGRQREYPNRGLFLIEIFLIWL